MGGSSNNGLSILQVSTAAHGGGAANIARWLFEAYRIHGHHSFLAVGYKRGSDYADSAILQIPNDRFRTLWSRFWNLLPSYFQSKELRGETRLRDKLLPLAEPRRALRRFRGLEDFDFPATRKLLDLTPSRPNVVHCHNLHGYYFDLRVLPELSRQVPVVLTLHDMWPLTGHCAYPIDCERWHTGCGQCPDLTVYPAVSRDMTAYNWQVKSDIFTRSRLFVSAPSQWLVDRARHSTLKAVEYRKIHNGVDLNIFHPVEQRRVRLELGLPPDMRILLFVGSRTQTNPYKDYTTVETAVREIANRAEGQDVMFVSLGGRRDGVSQIGSCPTRYYAFRSQQEDVARFYQAADVFLHAANVDTFPTTILEAMACGLPVIATAVGGIPEQIEDGVTGFLVPRGGALEMATKTLQLFDNEPLRSRFAQQAADLAKRKFDIRCQVNEYLSWYQELLLGGKEQYDS
jgi:glycosyltransferase involved in cell wall biosynthesis